MVILKLTSAGLNAALNSQENGIVLKIDKIKFGSGKYAVVDNDPRTAMINPFVSTQFVGGDVEPNSHTLRFNCSFKDTQSRDVYEIGLFTEENVLFAVASTTGEPFFTTSKTLVTVFIGGMKLGAFNSESVQIVLDENGAIALQLMGAHEGHQNPHPQYTFKSEFDALKQQNELEHNNLLTLITATAQNANVSLEEAVNFFSSQLLQHKNANNPHPQYLLASTFGVDLPMTATTETSVDDSHRVFGWVGNGGDTLFSRLGQTWWSKYQETVSFKPYRSYGTFLLYCEFRSGGWGFIDVEIFDENSNSLGKTRAFQGGNKWDIERIRSLFYIPMRGYAEITYRMEVHNGSKGHMKGSVFVDDRVKLFSPVGYTSIVDNADSSSGIVQGEEEILDYSTYPNFEWFYYDSNTSQYIELNAASSFDSPAIRSPHFHRGLLAGSLDKDLWIMIEVGTQSIQTPSDYARQDIQVVRGKTDANGNIVVTIPLSMRSISIAENFKAIFKLSYYDVEVVVETPFPAGALDGEHTIYVTSNS